MKKDFWNKLKRAAAGVLAAILLLTVVNVSWEWGIMPLVDYVEEEYTHD